MTNKKNKAVDVQGLTTKINFQGEHLFEDKFMTRYSNEPMTIEVSSIYIDGFPFMLIRMADEDGNFQNDLTEIFCKYSEIREWIGRLHFSDEDEIKFFELVRDNADEIWKLYNLRDYLARTWNALYDDLF